MMNTVAAEKVHMVAFDSCIPSTVGLSQEDSSAKCRIISKFEESPTRKAEDKCRLRGGEMG